MATLDVVVASSNGLNLDWILYLLMVCCDRSTGIVGFEVPFICSKKVVSEIQVTHSYGPILLIHELEL